MEELKKLLAEMAKEWADFKSDNDRRLKEVEKNGRADPLTEEKITKHSAAIGALEKQIKEVEKAAQRIPAGDAKAKNAAHLEKFRAFMRKDGLQAFAKSVSTDDDPAGGYAIPSSVDATIIEYEQDLNVMRPLCNVIPVANENYSQLVSKGSAGSGWVGEREARGETTTPDLAELKPYFGEIYANPASTQRALDDGSNAESWLAKAVAIEFAAQENDAFTDGTGVKKPKGILAYTLAATADSTRTFGQIEKLHTASSGAFTIDKLIDLIHLMHPGYRNGATIMTTSLGLAAIRKLKSGDVYVYQPSMFAGQPSQMLGYPVVENEDMPVPAADANALIFGNFKRGYTICDVPSTSMLRDPYTNKPFVHFYTTKRVGGHVVNDRCFKVLRLSA